MSGLGRFSRADLRASRPAGGWYDADRAPEADACGASGCRQEEYLLRVDVHAGRTRVLCPRHALNFIISEGTGDGSGG